MAEDPYGLGAEPTANASTYVKPQDMAWQDTRFEGIQIKVLYHDADQGEMTCMLKWAPGATLPFHRHPELDRVMSLKGRSRTMTASVAPANMSGVKRAPNTRPTARTGV